MTACKPLSLTALILLVFVGGCQSQTPLFVEPPKPHVDPSILAECGTVVNIPDRDLVPDETNRLWAKDRATLGDCRRKNHAKGQTIRALVK